MQKNNSNTQKSPVRSRSATDQNRDIHGRFLSSKSENSHHSHNMDESKLLSKESYNGGSTYGEHLVAVN